MKIEAAARRYAQAVLDLATEQNETEGWASDLEAIGAVLGHPEAIALLESSKVSPEDKERFLIVALGGLRPLAMNLARLLVNRRRASIAPQIFEEYQRLLDERRGVLHAQVVTAVPLADQERDLVASKLATIVGKTVVVEPRVDPAILGGLVVRIGDKLIDASTRARLVALKRNLQNSSY